MKKYDRKERENEERSRNKFLDKDKHSKNNFPPARKNPKYGRYGIIKYSF